MSSDNRNLIFQIFILPLVVLKTLRYLSTTTSILSDPLSLPQQAKQAVTKKRKT